MTAKNTVVIYRSFLGATKQYAKWLSEELDCDRVEFRKVNDDLLKQYDVVIVMSGTYLGRMPLVGFLKKHWPALQNKRVFVVAVGAISPENPASELSYQMIPNDIRTKIWYIKIPGRPVTSRAQDWKMNRKNIQHIISAVKIDAPAAS